MGVDSSSKIKKAMIAGTGDATNKNDFVAAPLSLLIRIIKITLAPIETAITCHVSANKKGSIQVIFGVSTLMINSIKKVGYACVNNVAFQ